MQRMKLLNLKLPYLTQYLLLFTFFVSLNFYPQKNEDELLKWNTEELKKANTAENLKTLSPEEIQVVF